MNSGSNASLTTPIPDFPIIMGREQYEFYKNYIAFHTIVSYDKYTSLNNGNKIRYWASLISEQDELMEELLTSTRNKIYTYILFYFIFVGPAILAVTGIPFFQSILPREVFFIIAFTLPLLLCVIVIYKGVTKMMSVKKASKIVKSSADMHLRELSYVIDDSNIQ